LSDIPALYSEKAARKWLQGIWAPLEAALPAEALERFVSLGVAQLAATQQANQWAKSWVTFGLDENLSLQRILALLSAMRRLPPNWVTPGWDLDAIISDVAVAWLSAAESRWGVLLEQRAHINEQLKVLDHLRADFISTLSHELRTPLTAIAGSCELLLEDFGDSLAEVPKEYIYLIDRSTALVRQLIDDVLDYTKLEAGEIKLYPEKVNIEELIKDTLRMLTPLREKSKLHVEIAIGPDVPDLFIDLMRIRQVLINLLSNAFKFTPEGGTVRVTSALSPAKTHIEISVSDTGPGIGPNDLLQVFERFKQVGDGPRKRGTGLGLPITKRLVELHKGEITLTSEVGHGANFTVTLPIEPQAL
jgi:signal transduction histidine kinase